MIVHKDINSAVIKNPFVTVGVFDGVHLGHQLIFKELNAFSEINRGESTVITFWPHPKMVIDSAKDDLMMITSIDEKIELIEKMGIDHLIVLPFTKEFSHLTSKDFIEYYLCEKLNIKGLLIGFNHRFGKDREGNFEVLKQYADRLQFKIKKVEALSVDNVSISSTIIRNALLNGQIEKANSYLSREFTILGEVVNGKQLGRDIGFPTANINADFNLKLIPRDGVYAVKVQVNSVEYPGMLNIGNRPTVNLGNEGKSIEVHIIGFIGNLYGEKIQISFYSRVRDEIKFKDIHQLVQQLNKDKVNIMNYFSKMKGN